MVIPQAHYYDPHREIYLLKKKVINHFNQETI